MSFFKRSLLYFLLSFILFLASISINDWLVDHLIPILLIGLSISALIYVLFRWLSSLFRTNIRFFKVDFFLPLFPFFLAVFIYFLQGEDLIKIEGLLVETQEKITNCESVSNCDISMKYIPFKKGIKVKFTQGVTTVDVRYFFSGECLNVSPSYSVLRDKYYKFCRDIPDRKAE